MITSSVNRVIYKGNGSATEFAYPFKIFDRTDLKVLLIDKNGNRTILTSDYYISMDEMKVYYPGYVPGVQSKPETERPPVLANGETLVIYRDIPINQMDDLPNNYPFDVIEKMDDRGCVIAQQLADKIGRAVTVGEETIIDFDGTLPPIEAGKALRINAEGTGWEFTEDPEVAYQKADTAKAEAAAQANSAALSAESANRAAQRAYDDGRAIIEHNVQAAQNAATNAQAVLQETTETATQVTERLDQLSNDGIFEYDADINIQPVELPVRGKYFELDSQGNLIPVNINSIVGGLINDVDGKQDRLTAGNNITIDENNVISAAGGGGGTGEIPEEVLEQIDQNTTEIETLKTENLQQSDEIVQLSESVVEISDVVFQKSDNLFDVSLQTEETISPHYFVSGVPYSSTQFDKTWHCSAPVEVLPNTQYTIGCIPSFSGVTKPWNNAGEGIFFYDENMAYIGKINANTFTTPNNARYIRFNFYIKFTGHSELYSLSRCVLIAGNELPAKYISYENTNIRQDLNALKNDVDSLKSISGFLYKIDLQSKEMLVSYKYTNTQDCIIRMACGGGNGLFDFRAMYLFDNSEAPKIHDITGVTAWDNMNGDTFAPMQIKAVNNIDGDNLDGSTYRKYFTGGNHQYNNTGNGSTPTASCQNVKFYVNGFEIVENKTGVTNEIKVTWENLIQGYNTTKADGTGRAILKERKSVVFDGVSFNCHTELIPIEPIKCVLWYGYQLMHNSRYDSCQYVDGTNRSVYQRNAYTNCGDKEAKKLRIFHSVNNDCIDVEITDFDLGKRNLFTGTNGIFNTDYGKAYFNIINGERDMVEGGVYTLDGKYTFRKGFV